MSKALTGIAATALLLLSASVPPAGFSLPHAGTYFCVHPGVPGCQETITGALFLADDGDTIVIAPHVFHECVEIGKSVTLQGTAGDALGEFTTIMPALGNPNRPVLHILPGATVHLSMVRVTGGDWQGYQARGGGIKNEGLLYGSHILVDHNSILGVGGGIYSSGGLILEDSSVVYNNADYYFGAGYTIGYGGGIYSDWSMTTLTGVMVSHNVAGDLGGGVYASGTFNMTDSTISENSAVGSGGGVLLNMYTRVIPMATVADWDRSTIDRNSSGADGGGVANYGGILSMENVTVSGNTAAGRGGGILNGAMEHDPANSGTLAVWSSTIARNRSFSGQGGGIASRVSPIEGTSIATVYRSILAYNTGGNCLVEEPGFLLSWDYNVSDDDSCPFHYHRDLVNTDPLLNPLALNAPGVVMTHALQIGSPADDRVYENVGGTDARGVPRGIPACDAGAYEGTEPPKFSPSSGFSAKVKANATCRFGPGTSYAATGYLSAGESHQITGRNVDGSWLKLETCWVARSLLQTEADLEAIPVLLAPPLPTPTRSCWPTMGAGQCSAAGGTWVPAPVGMGPPGTGKCDCP